MDAFIRRQYTYRGSPNPFLRVDFVWRSSSPGKQNESESDDGSLSDVEQIKVERYLTWSDLNLADQVSILYDLCEWHMLSERFRERTGAYDLDMVTWRIEPIGRDSNDVLYYLLSNGRLYCQTDPCLQFDSRAKNHSNRPNEARHENREDWTCLATSYQEWVSFAETLIDPLDANERRLFSTVKQKLLPDIFAAEEERRSNAEKAEQSRIKDLLMAEALSTRKRSSRIQNIEERRHEDLVREAADRRQRKLENAAERLKMQQHAPVHITQPRLTREARARDRELRLFMQDRSLSQDPASSVCEPLESASVIMGETTNASPFAEQPTSVEPIGALNTGIDLVDLLNMPASVTPASIPNEISNDIAEHVTQIL